MLWNHSTNLHLLIDDTRARVLINSKSQQLCILLCDGYSGAGTKGHRQAQEHSLLYPRVLGLGGAPHRITRTDTGWSEAEDRSRGGAEAHPLISK